MQMSYSTVIPRLMVNILVIIIFFRAEDAKELWTVEEASSKLAVRPEWLTEFKGGLMFDENNNLNKFLNRQTYSEHDTRHDLLFLTPSGRKVRCKVMCKSS